MRPLELATIVLMFLYIVWLALRRSSQPSTFRFLPATAAIVVGFHVLLEGYRWHMAPAYAAVLVALLTYPWCKVHQFRLSFLSRTAGVGFILSLLLTAVFASAIVAPVFTFAPLTGPFAVGTVSLHLVDNNRLDSLAGVAGVKREVMIQVWYPAEREAAGQIARYADGMVGSRLARVHTRSFVNPRVSGAQSRYPVVFFEHMFVGSRYQNTFQLEELGSHGFVVVAADHPYLSNLTIFPDGRRVQGTAAVYLDFSSDDGLNKSKAARNSEMLIRLADVQFVLDKLVEWNRLDPNGRFTGRLDLDHVAIIGHSFGGSVAAEACARDARFIAGMDIDGDLFGQSARLGIPRPFFFMIEDVANPTDSEIRAAAPQIRRELSSLRDAYDAINRSFESYGGYFLTARGLMHMNYTDTPLLSHLKSRTGAGSIEPRRAHEIVNRYSVAFLEKYLYGRPQPLLEEAAKPYPEARFENHRPPQQQSGRSEHP